MAAASGAQAATVTVAAEACQRGLEPTNPNGLLKLSPGAPGPGQPLGVA